jgi:hypothetical protein
MTFAGHFLDLLAIPRVAATVRFGPAPLAGDDRKELAAALHDAVEERFVPVVGST